VKKFAVGIHGRLDSVPAGIATAKNSIPLLLPCTELHLTQGKYFPPSCGFSRKRDDSEWSANPMTFTQNLKSAINSIQLSKPNDTY
jgi:hypothetical protein